MTDLFSSIQPKTFGTAAYPSTTPTFGRGYEIDLLHGKIIYIPAFIEKKIADRTLQVLFENNEYDWHNTNWHDVEDVENVGWKSIQWQQDTVKMYGKTHSLPRVSAWYGDTGKSYKYSGILLHPKAWTPALLWLKEQLNQVCSDEFNSVLLNWYRSGQDHISWHTDAEKELGKNPTIASLNFGEARRFLLREKDNPTNKLEFSLGHGDLLIMQGALQHHWQHSIPKQAKIQKGRLNMTFRKILSV